MARKKIVYVIVEGPSDEEALGAILTKYFDTNKIYVEIKRFDVTTKKGNHPSNIIRKVAAGIQKYAKDNHFTKVHFQEIIHLVDTDGAYIDPSSVVENLTLTDHVYTLDKIETSNVQGIRDRNFQKGANMTKLYQTNLIWGLPYHVYYMSCNLDHVLYNKQNSTDLEKETNSYDFAKKYRNDIPAFIKFIQSSNFSICGDYKDSWTHIKEDANSLNRYTNFGIRFQSSVQ